MYNKGIDSQGVCTKIRKTKVKKNNNKKQLKDIVCIPLGSGGYSWSYPIEALIKMVIL